MSLPPLGVPSPKSRLHGWPQGSRRAISATVVSERDKVQPPIPRVDRPASSSAGVTAQSPSPVVAFTRLLSHQHLRSLDPAALQSALPALVVLARRGTALLCLASDQDVRESVHAAVSSTATLSLHAPPALQFVKMAPRIPGHAVAMQPPPALPHAASGCVYLQVVQVTGHWQDQSQQPLSSSQDPSGSGGEVPALAEAARSLRRVLGCSAQARAAVTAMAADWERGAELAVVIQPGGTGRGMGG